MIVVIIRMQLKPHGSVKTSFSFSGPSISLHTFAPIAKKYSGLMKNPDIQIREIQT
jgi:hypothetical protein